MEGALVAGFDPNKPPLGALAVVDEKSPPLGAEVAGADPESPPVEAGVAAAPNKPPLGADVVGAPNRDDPEAVVAGLPKLRGA